MAAEQLDDREMRIGRIVNEYLDRRQRGDAVREQDIIESHPELADELRAHFGMVRQVMSVSSPHGCLDDSGPAPAPDFLPGYDILNEIHRGGQGVVYLALQKATRRQVAIKVTREGPFAGWRDRARFEREVHVLGALRHPSIVTIHDSGVAAGCQYFVMDYISGATLDVWLTSAPRSIGQILRLFVLICDAINAAHIKGIIHRDLKPGNIRVDADNRPHILDFGLAKVTSEPEPDRTGMTAVGQFVGSLPWTSPEQVQGTLDQVDTRTDVYALGVILYQMLTGTFPYDVVGPVRDVLNRIVSIEPARPSALRREIDRDVDAIVLKCLRKEPQRRYQTAGELGQDIERHLGGRPIAARSDSGLYVLGRMLRRHRVPVVVAAAFAVLVTGSLLASLSLWRRAVVQRDRAILAEREQGLQRSRADARAIEAQQARDIAEHERGIARRQAERLRRIDYFNRIARAAGAYEQRYMSQALRLLEDCPADLREWEWYHLRQLCRQPALLEIPGADSKFVSVLAVAPGGRTVVTGGYDGLVKLWDAHTGEKLSEFAGHALQIRALALSPDGRLVASAGLDRSIRLWDIRGGGHRVIDESKEYIHCVAFSPDSRMLVSGGQDKMLTFRDVASGRAVSHSAAHEGEVLAVAFSPDGRQVVSGEHLNPLRSRTSKVRLWDIAGNESRVLTEHTASILAVAFSPDGRLVASGSSMPASGRSASGTLKICNAAGGEELFSLRGHEGFVAALAFSPDGKLLASGGAPQISAYGGESDHTLKIWNVASGSESAIYSAHQGGGRTVAWSPDAARVYSGGNDGSWKVWPRMSPSEALVLPAHLGAVQRIAFSPDGKRLVSSGGRSGSERPALTDKAIRVWDLESSSPARPELLLSGHEDTVLGLAWSPDGRLIASGGSDGAIRLWNSTGGEQTAVLSGQNQPIQSLAFSPRSGPANLLAAVAGNTATLWRTAERRVVRQLQQNETLAAVAFSPDGLSIATGSIGGTIRVLDPETGVQNREIASGSGLTSLTYGPDSRTIAAGHANGSLTLWSLSTGEQLAAMTGTQRPVQSLAFSPDGQRIASCNTDPMLRLWDTGSGAEVYTLRAHDGAVTCVTFSPDGRRIATSGEDGLIRLWDAPIRVDTRPEKAAAGSRPTAAEVMVTK